MAADKIQNEIGYQRENQKNNGRAGNRLTDSGVSLNMHPVVTMLAKSEQDIRWVDAIACHVYGLPDLC